MQEHGNFLGPNQSGSCNRSHTLPPRVPPPLPSLRPNAGGTGQSPAVNSPAGPGNTPSDSVGVDLLSDYLLLIVKPH